MSVSMLAFDAVCCHPTVSPEDMASRTPPNDASPRPKKKRRVNELMESLLAHRRGEERLFKKLMRRLKTVYQQISMFTAETLKKRTNSEATDPEEFQRLSAELVQFASLHWREQARGPTSTRSVKVDDIDHYKQWDHHPIWLLYTPRTERTVQTHGRTLNHADGAFMTWGLPSASAFDRRVFKQCRPVFVIEKVKGGSHVQHRIKNMYVCLTKAKSDDDRVYLVTWTHFMERVIGGSKVKSPLWCTRNGQ